MFKNFYLKYIKGDVVAKFIFANVLVYVFLLFIGTFSKLFNFPGMAVAVRSVLELPASLWRLALYPWTLFTYMFIHGGAWHLLWNMLALYGFGRIFLNFFSVRQFVWYYILGGLSGALFYVAAYNVFPGFNEGLLSGSCLVGSSAAVVSIIVATAVRSPQYRINLFLVGSIRLSTLALVAVVISLLMLSGDNAGGNFAHLGGAFAGWLLALMLGRGVDVIQQICKPFEWFASLFRKTPRKKGKFTYVKSERSADYEYNARKRADEAEVDRILEKIKHGGYASLSDEEKKRLFEASSK